MKHVKKAQRWLEEELLWLWYDAPVIILPSAIIITTIIAGAVIGNLVWTANKSKCLNSQEPRRWHNAICEQYEDGEWVKVDPFREIDFHYNSAGEMIE